jgi:hypothetical protein
LGPIDTSSDKESAKQSEPAGGRAPADHRSAEQRAAEQRAAEQRAAEQREIIVSRRLSAWVLGILAAAPLAPAFGQNLDAGKSGAQIFSEVCANCHRSPREVRANAGASFLREHYTTGTDMASTMASYLSGAGGTGAAAAQPKRPPASGATTATTTRDTPAADPSPRRGQQAADPKAPAQPGPTRGRAASARAEADTKPPGAPPAPVLPVLEEFEE